VGGPFNPCARSGGKPEKTAREPTEKTARGSLRAVFSGLKSAYTPVRCALARFVFVLLDSHTFDGGLHRAQAFNILLNMPVTSFQFHFDRRKPCDIATIMYMKTAVAAALVAAASAFAPTSVGVAQV
jgi:hypothetical protein